MSDRFNDDNFIEAAKAYQNIKAPSGLREKVIEGARYGQYSPEETAGRNSRTETSVRRASASSRRIYRFGALAACLAIMVVSMPGLLKAADMETLLHGSELAAGIVPFPEQQDAPEGNGEGKEDPSGENAADLAKARIAEPESASLPVTAAEEPAPEEQPAYDPSTAAYSLNPVEEDGQEERVPVQETEAEPEKEFPGSQESYSASLALSKLIPTMLGDESTVEGWEVRLVEAEDGRCTVEIASGEETAAVMTMAKNAESGHWEVSSQPAE